MQTVKCPNGVELSWDETLTVGELVTAYRSGFHVLHLIEPRDGITPIMHYVQVVKKNGSVVKTGTADSCDASYVRRVTRDQIDAMFADDLAVAIEKRDNLIKFASSIL